MSRSFEEIMLNPSSIETEEFMALNKAQLQQLVDKLRKVAKPRGPGRKDEILALLQEGPKSISEMAEAVGIKPTNVSSQLKYLRDAGWVIHTDDQGRRYLAQDTPRVVEVEPVEPVESVELVDTPAE